MMPTDTTFPKGENEAPPRSDTRVIQMMYSVTWRLYFGVAQYGPFLMVLASATAGFFCFVELAFGCSSLVQNYKTQSGNSDEADAGTSYFYGVWQQHGGSEANNNLCQPYTMRGKDTEETPAPSVLLLARVCSVVGILCSTAHMLFLSSSVCIMYPRPTIHLVGGCVGILMILFTAGIVVSGLWSSSLLCLQDTSSTTGIAAWLMGYATQGPCSVHQSQKVVWFQVLCWGVTGLGTRWLGESSLEKCQFRGRNVANACRVDSANLKDGDPPVSVFGGDEEENACSTVPPTLVGDVPQTPQLDQ